MADTLSIGVDESGPYLIEEEPPATLTISRALLESGKERRAQPRNHWMSWAAVEGQLAFFLTDYEIFYQLQSDDGETLTFTLIDATAIP